MLGPCRAIPFAAFRAYHAVGLFARVGISSSLTAPVVVVGVTGSRSVSAASCCPRLFCPATSYLSDFRTPSLHKLNSWRLAATMHRWAPYFTGSRSMESREDAPAAMKRERGNCFPLSETCKLVLQRGDITKWHVDGQTDAIVRSHHLHTWPCPLSIRLCSQPCSRDSIILVNSSATLALCCTPVVLWNGFSTDHSRGRRTFRSTRPIRECWGVEGWTEVRG